MREHVVMVRVVGVSSVQIEASAYNPTAVNDRNIESFNLTFRFQSPNLYPRPRYQLPEEMCPDK